MTTFFGRRYLKLSETHSDGKRFAYLEPQSAMNQVKSKEKSPAGRQGNKVINRSNITNMLRSIRSNKQNQAKRVGMKQIVVELNKS